MKHNEPAGYRAYISYSHVDKKWGDWLHKALETYRVPKPLVGQSSRAGPVPKRLFPVFRDREELPTATSLGEQIEQALEQSEYLIVICSPRSAKSMWVNEEILQFKRKGRSDRILAIIVDGEPNASDKPGMEDQECFPPALRFEIKDDGTLSEERTEPIAADARKDGDGPRAAKLKLIAGLLGVKYDALAQRDRRRRAIRLTGLSVLATSTLLSFLLLLLYGETNRQKEEQQRLIEQSQRLAELAAEQSARGVHDRALLFALSALPGLYGGERPWLDTARVEVEKAAFMQRKAAVFPHSDKVRHTAYSADGRLVLTASADHTAVVWDRQSGQRLATVEHQSGVWHAAFCLDEQLILTASSDGTAVLWDMTAAKPRFVLQHEESVGWVECASTNEHLATVAGHQAVLWNARTGERVVALDHDDSVVTARFSPDGQRLLTVAGTMFTDSGHHQAYLWDVRSGQIIARLSHSDTVNSAVFDPTGQRVVTASDDHTAVIWDAVTGQQLVALPHSFKVADAAFSPDGLRIATGEFGVFVWHTQSGELLIELPEDDYIDSVSFSADGTAVLATLANAAGVWDLESQGLLWWLMHEDIIHRASFGPSRFEVLVASGDGSAAVWDGLRGRQDTLLRADVAIQSLEFNANSSRLLTLSVHGQASLWRAPDWQLDVVIDSSAPIIEARFDQSGSRVVTIDDRQTVALWDAASGEPLVALAHEFEVATAMLGPHGNWLVTLAVASPGRLWNAASGELVAILPISSSPEVERGLASVGAESDSSLPPSRDWLRGLRDYRLFGNPIAVDFSPDGQRLLLMYGSDAVVFDIASGQIVQAFQPEGSARRGVFSPDGLKILAISHDRAQLWQTDSGEHRLDLAVPGWLLDAAFLDDGASVILVAQDGTAVIRRSADGERIQHLELSSGLDRFAVSSDSQRLATFGRLQATLWDRATGQQLTVLARGERHADLAFSPDGQVLAVASPSGALVSTLPPRAEQVLVDPAAFLPVNRRCLTDQERSRFSLPLNGRPQRLEIDC